MSRKKRLRKPKNTAHNLNVIRRAREARGWTQADLCARTKLSYNTVAFAERGGPCSESTAMKLTKTLGVTVKPASVPPPQPTKGKTAKKAARRVSRQQRLSRKNKEQDEAVTTEQIDELLEQNPIPMERLINLAATRLADPSPEQGGGFAESIEDPNSQGSVEMGQPTAERDEAGEGTQCDVSLPPE